MPISEKQIRATENRYSDRGLRREEILRKIDWGSVLEVDRPEQVIKRVARLARVPAIAGALAKAVLLAGTPNVYAAGAPARTLIERVLTASGNLLDVNYLQKAMRACRPVARVHAELRGQAADLYSTGFLISPRLLLTNFHVFANPADADRGIVEFNYQLGAEDETLRSFRFHLDPESFFLNDENLDYCLVAVRDFSGCGVPLRSFGWEKLTISEEVVILGEFLNIVEHLDGLPKQFALRENQVIDVLPDFLHYRTELVPVCSGAPVFNDQWELVGLHHSGVPRRDEYDHILTPERKQWTEQMGERMVDWIVGEAVRIDRIVAHVDGQQSLSGRELTLWEEAFAPVGRSSSPSS